MKRRRRREIGRIERTLFTLDWLEQPDLRRQATAELNKGEARNALARAAVHRLTVVFHPGETVETDIASDKMLLRCRGAVSDFYARSGVRGGDLVHLHSDEDGTLHVQAIGR